MAKKSSRSSGYRTKKAAKKSVRRKAYVYAVGSEVAAIKYGGLSKPNWQVSLVRNLMDEGYTPTEAHALVNLVGS